MGFWYSLERAKISSLRKLPFLPRIGIYIDFAGYELNIKFAPLLEAVLNLPERGFSRYYLEKTIREQFAEITFAKKKKERIVDL